MEETRSGIITVGGGGQSMVEEVKCGRGWKAKCGGGKVEEVEVEVGGVGEGG